MQSLGRNNKNSRGGDGDRLLLARALPFGLLPSSSVLLPSASSCSPPCRAAVNQLEQARLPGRSSPIERRGRLKGRNTVNSVGVSGAGHAFRAGRCVSPASVRWTLAAPLGADHSAQTFRSVTSDLSPDGTATSGLARDALETPLAAVSRLVSRPQRFSASYRTAC